MITKGFKISFLVFITLTAVSALYARKLSVSLEGNQNFSKRRLERAMMLRMPEAGFCADSLEISVLRLESFYRRNGFANCRVEYMIDSLAGTGEVRLRLLINEGDRYFVQKIEFIGNSNLGSALLGRAVFNRIGKPLNAEDLGQDDFNLMLLYADHGYIYAEADHAVEFQNGHKAHLKYSVTEGPQVSISELVLSGNRYVKDGFVAKAVSFKAGDVFSRSELIKSRFLLQSSGLFSEIDITPGAIDTSTDGIAVTVNVKEKPRRLFETSLGYGSGDAVRLMTKWAHRNLFGMGRKLEYNGMISFQTRLPLTMIRGRSAVSYDDPYFNLFNTPAGGEVYYDDFRPGYTDYRLETVGFNFFLSTQFSSTVTIDYKWKQEWLKLSPNWQITKYKSDTLTYKGRRSLSVTSSYDNLNDPVHPQSGLSGYLELEYTGGIMGGSETFQRAVNNWTYFFKVPKHRIYITNRLRYGIVGDWSKKAVIPGYEKFYLGGSSTVRGYGQNAIGPVDQNGRVIGGRIMVLVNGQASIDIGRNWSLAGFIDGGMLSNSTFEKQSLAEMVSSPGLGLRYTLPFGTGRMDFAAPGTLMDQIKYWRWMIAWGEPF